MYYDDEEYANKRLAGTLVRTKDGIPFVVNGVERSGKTLLCSGMTLPDENYNVLDLTDVDLTPVPLGFYNNEDKMFFACRKPLRRDYKQGLSRQNLVVYGSDRSPAFKLLVPTILNQYPSVAKVMSYLDAKSSGSRAFSRDFGLSKKDGEIALCYRKYRVGRVEKGVLVLNRDKFFLEQHLSESVGK